MGKRSSYEKNPRDYYKTPKSAVLPLKNLLPAGTIYAEPCAGDGQLIRYLQEVCDAACIFAGDIEPQVDWITEADASLLQSSDILPDVSYIITNPPFTWSVLKPLLDHWLTIAPTLLLLPADFMHNQRMTPYMEKCAWVVSIGRVKWIEGSKATGVDNYAWFMFDTKRDENSTPTFFFGR